MGCSSRRGSASCVLWGVARDALRVRNLLEASETGFIECKAIFEATFYSNL